MTDIDIKHPKLPANNRAIVHPPTMLDGIRKTRVYRIIPRIIDTTVQLRVPLPPRIRLLRPMLSAAFLVIIFCAGWIGLAVSANRTLSIDGTVPVDATNIPFPDELELIGPIPLTTSQPDATEVVAAFMKLLTQYRETSSEVLSVDQLAGQVELLHKFFADKGSPLANDRPALEALAGARNKRMIIAISFVESNYAKHAPYFNASGIGGSNLRQYRSFANWILDFDRLLERRYNGLSPDAMNGYYVQPPSANWVNGVYQVLRELDKRGIK
jgi:hypothetical protein